tara:strand:- start:645 stop:875 length:231 start_codon:yes stop_codon:yes gene_type:complete
MEFSIENIPNIVECDYCTKEKKVDRLLELDAVMYTNMGIDTTKSDRKIVKRNSRKIYYAIKQINPELGTKLIQAMD